MWFIGFGILALVLAMTPLFNILAYEFCAVVTLGIVIAGAHVAMTELQLMKKNLSSLAGSPRDVIFACLFRSLRSNLVLLLVPLIIILLNGFRIKNCNYIDGFIFFLLLPVISCITVTASGVFFNTLIEKRWLAYIVYLAFLILTCIPTLINLIFHPPVFAFHPIIGYFPGPIYDFVISITPTLIISRVQSLIWTVLFIAILFFTCDINRQTGLVPRIQWRNLIKVSSYRTISKILTVLVLLLIVIGFELYSGKLGIRPSRKDIAMELGGYRETEHFEIYYARELEEKIDLFADDCEFRFYQLSTYLQTENSRKVRAYLYSSPEQKKRLIGAGNTFVEDPFGYGFHLHPQGFPHPVLKHELAHVLTADWSPWKVSLNVGVHEGVAVAADWDEGNLTVHQWAKAMRHFKVAPPLSSVMSLGFWKHASSRSYLMAGSFIRFLIDKYGIDKIKQAFPIGNIQKSYMKDMLELEGEWIKFLLNDVSLDEKEITYAENRLKRGGIFEQVCAHEMAALRNDAWEAYYNNDYISALNIFQQMLTNEPENSRTLRGMMFSAFRTGNYELTTSIANRIISNDNAQYRAEAAQLLGDINWLQGDVSAALISYESVSILNPRESVKFNNILRIAALTDSYKPDSRDRLKSVLIPRSKYDKILSGTKMALLLRVINTEPNRWLAYYLAGELLHFENAWDMSIQYLHHALHLGEEKDSTKIHHNLYMKAKNLLALNSYYKKDYVIAERIFASIAEDQSLSLGEVLSAKDWVQRCQWAEKTIP